MRAAQRTRSLRAMLTREITILPHRAYSPRRPSPHHSFTMMGARHNVLAFSCEAANAMIECSQSAARLRLLQRPVRPAADTNHFTHVRLKTSLPRFAHCDLAQARGGQPDESIAITVALLRRASYPRAGACTTDLSTATCSTTSMRAAHAHSILGHMLRRSVTRPLPRTQSPLRTSPHHLVCDAGGAA
jgi:hypothetical protein